MRQPTGLLLSCKAAVVPFSRRVSLPPVTDTPACRRASAALREKQSRIAEASRRGLAAGTLAVSAAAAGCRRRCVLRARSRCAENDRGRSEVFLGLRYKAEGLDEKAELDRLGRDLTGRYPVESHDGFD